MAASRSIVVAGGGIGGLTAALALAARGMRVVVLEQAAKIESIGAGIQLSPNATRVLANLKLDAALASYVTAPEDIRVMTRGKARPHLRIPLGRHAAERYGAPFWAIHRGDLQHVLAAAAEAEPNITLRLGVRAEDIAAHPQGVTVGARRGGLMVEERGGALVAADGLWSAIRARLGDGTPPRPAGRTAWRALVDARDVADELREPAIHLWLGAAAHLVHYPVRGGRAINIVAIVRDAAAKPGWNATAARDELLNRLPASVFAKPARRLLEVPAQWSTWSLYDRPARAVNGRGPVTLLGDAAHPMLPFLAQGGAMAIEDAAILAHMLGRAPDDPEAAFRGYEQARRERTLRAQQAARANGRIYHLSGLPALARDLVMRVTGGEGMLARYDWLYGWSG